MATVREAKRATVDDLYRTPGKAGPVNGEVVLMSPTAAKPGAAADAIFGRSILAHDLFSN